MPELTQYQDCWPAQSYLRVYLGNRLQSARSRALSRAKSGAQSSREEDEEEDEENEPEPEPTAATASPDVPSPVGIYYSVVRETDD